MLHEIIKFKKKIEEMVLQQNLKFENRIQTTLGQISNNFKSTRNIQDNISESSQNNNK